jgi:hypothetical protein
MNQIESRESAGVIMASGVADTVLRALLARFGLELRWVSSGNAIPGSFWGDSEAGLIGNVIYARDDTPLHSVLHESCHYICMDESRRAGLHTDAGGDTDEENGVCYLQILLAEQIPGMGKVRMWRDMDAWGYSFRLGSARAWFEQDAADALKWLQNHSLVDACGEVLYRLRR